VQEEVMKVQEETVRVGEIWVDLESGGPLSQNGLI